MIRKFFGLFQGLVTKTLARSFYAFFASSAFKSDFLGEIKDWKPDLVHAHDFATLATATTLGDSLNVPVIFDSHELELHRNPPRPLLDRVFVKRLESKLLPKCAAITTVCDSIAGYLADEYHIERPTVMVNSPALKSRPGSPRWNRRPGITLRVDAGVSQNAFVVTYIGNVAVNRGLEVVVAALSRLPSNVVLVVIGKASEDDTLKFGQMAREFDVAERIRFLEPVHPNKVVDYIADADCAVIPILPVTLSYEFALPNKLFEAAFAGLPIVAADLHELSRIIQSHSLGLLYDPFDPAKCAEAIAQVWEEAKSRSSRKAETSEFVQAYCWENQESKLGELVAKIFTEKR